MAEKDDWIEGLRAELPKLDSSAEELENGKVKVGWARADGTLIDNSEHWAKQYRQVAKNYREIISRHDAKK